MKIVKIGPMILTGMILAISPFFVQNLHASQEDKNIIIENAEMRLVIGSDGKAVSLLHKPSGEECLEVGVRSPIMTLTEYRPYDSENMLTYVARSTAFPANEITREGNKLKVKFDRIAYTATITLDIQPEYIGFTLTGLDYELEEVSDWKRKTEIDEFTLLQLPIKKRSHFGEWLNLVWDENVAVGIVATDPYGKIDAQDNEAYYLMQAGMENIVNLLDVGVALVATDKNKILDNIDRIEQDYGLPLGVQSRRSEAYKYSYYEMRGLTPQNIDEHIANAKKGGFRMMTFYWTDFAESLGHFAWRKEYPNGIEDLKYIAGKMRAAGIIPGFHIHYNKATRNDPYVTPIPDGRLNLSEIFTLKAPLDIAATEIIVEENPRTCTLENRRRILKLGDELIEYSGYITEAPYRFTGCIRGLLGTTPQHSPKGTKFGLLDVDTSPRYVRFDQRTDIQQEVAARLAHICDEIGVSFIYFDGGEDVHPPYWYWGSKAQLDVYNACNFKPLVSEGALKTHFSWHILTRANAYDVFKPEVFREGVRRYMLRGARYMADNFTSINFGWNIYLAPSDGSNGMQPDMYEYVCSRGAGWDSPISLMVVSLDEIRNHPRSDDNFEVMKNWEDARLSGFFSEEQKDMLKDAYQEHILIRNSKGGFNLFPYKKINVAQNSNDIIAYLFERNNETWVLYWHPTGSAEIRLPVKPGLVELFYKIDIKAREKQRSKEYCIFPVDNRRFLKFNLPAEEVISLLEKSTILNSRISVLDNVKSKEK